MRRKYWIKAIISDDTEMVYHHFDADVDSDNGNVIHSVFVHGVHHPSTYYWTNKKKALEFCKRLNHSNFQLYSLNGSQYTAAWFTVEELEETID